MQVTPAFLSSVASFYDQITPEAIRESLRGLRATTPFVDVTAAIVLRSHTHPDAGAVIDALLPPEEGIGAFASINAQLGYRPNPVTRYAIRAMRAMVLVSPAPIDAAPLQPRDVPTPEPAPGEVRVDDKPEPELTAPDEAIVRVEASGFYENWHVTLPDGRMWIGLPGGGVSEIDLSPLIRPRMADRCF